MTNQSKIPSIMFVESYKENLGTNAAEQLIRQVIQRAGLPYQTEYTKEEALKICRQLKQYLGFIGVIGGILNSRITIR
jgi:hypothetical protein